MNVRKLLLCAAGFVALSAASASVADAAPIITWTAGASVSPEPSDVPPSNITILQNFNSGTGPYGFSTDKLGTTAAVLNTDYVLCTTSNGVTCANPNSGNSQYFAELGATPPNTTRSLFDILSGGSLNTEIEFDWGTASSDNVLTVFFSDNSSAMFSVSNSTAPNGGNYNKNGLLDIKAGSGLYITELEFTTTLNSFEIDNIARVNAAVPEPASLSIFGAALLGLAGMAGWMRRNRATASV